MNHEEREEKKKLPKKQTAEASKTHTNEHG